MLHDNTDQYLHFTLHHSKLSIGKILRNIIDMHGKNKLNKQATGTLSDRQVYKIYCSTDFLGVVPVTLPRKLFFIKMPNLFALHS